MAFGASQPHAIGHWRTVDLRAAATLETYGAQLGEMCWHTLHVDSTLDDVTSKHSQVMIDLVERHRLRPKGRPIRLLELGAYAHYSVHRAASLLGGASVAHDISPASLSLGAALADKAGFSGDRVLVAGDFHDLPFSDGYFDLVFCASSVHHTWRPWMMLAEAKRVLRKGGMLHLENEPVGRKLCFYAFRGNRPGGSEATPFELELERRGMTWTISSPFPGSRPEELFGMIENDRIPLSIYDRALSKGMTRVERTLTPLPMGALEQDLLALERGDDLERAIATRLIDEIAPLAEAFTEADALMGFTLPSNDAIWTLSYSLAHALRTMPREAPGGDAMAEFLGAALRTSAIKTDSASSNELFRREVPMRSKVFRDTPSGKSVGVDLDDRLPDLADDQSRIVSVFGAPQWVIVGESNGYNSICTAQAQCKIDLPNKDYEGLLFLRIYSVPSDQVYSVNILINERLGYSHKVCIAETHLARLLVPANADVVLETRGQDGSLISLPLQTRVATAKLFKITDAG